MTLSVPFLKAEVIKKHAFIFLVIGIAITGGIIAFPLSYVTNPNELIGICLLPFAIFFQGKKQFNYFFFFTTLLFGAGAYYYSVKLFYFFAISFYILWLVEIYIGRVNSLVVFLLGLMSPIFVQVTAILGFPIRLQLSNLAGNILQWIGLTIKIEGNMLLLNDSLFSVDDACMGLNMLAISMLMGVFIITYQYRKHKKLLGFQQLIPFFFAILLLNIVANLFRIIILVLFKVMPDNPMHEVIGLLCLIGYVVIPLYFLGNRIVSKYGHLPTYTGSETRIRLFGKTSLVLASLTLLLIGVHINDHRTHTISEPPIVTAQGLQGTVINDNITKLENDVILIYVKPIPEFFSGEHTPLLCWKGSGYTFRSIKKSIVSGQEIYLGQLVKNKETLFTAWWYSNGTIQTIHQGDWRLRMLKGEAKFCLVNLTAKTEASLLQQMKSLFEKKSLTIKYDN